MVKTLLVIKEAEKLRLDMWESKFGWSAMFFFIIDIEWPRSEAFLGRAKNQKKSRKPFCRKFHGDYFFEIFRKKFSNFWRFLIGWKKMLKSNFWPRKWNRRVKLHQKTYFMLFFKIGKGTFRVVENCKNRHFLAKLNFFLKKLIPSNLVLICLVAPNCVLYN